jgi:hypothetical protein
MKGGDGFYQRGGWATKVVRAFIERRKKEDRAGVPKKAVAPRGCAQ